MDKTIAHQLLDQELAQIRQSGYRSLVRRIGESECREVTGPDGKNYQIERNIVWDDRENGPIRVLLAIDDGGWRAFLPLTADDIIPPE